MSWKWPAVILVMGACGALAQTSQPVSPQASAPPPAAAPTAVGTTGGTATPAAAQPLFPPVGSGASTGPTTGPHAQSAEEMLNDLLRPTTQTAQPLEPVKDGGGGVIDHTTPLVQLGPDGLPLNLLPEGTVIVDRVGRITRTPDGHDWELTLESDGKILKDPPMLLLPNKVLTQMQSAMINNNQDMRFRVSGEVTEYNNRNYLLVQKASEVPLLTQPLRSE